VMPYAGDGEMKQYEFDAAQRAALQTINAKIDEWAANAGFLERRAEDSIREYVQQWLPDVVQDALQAAEDARTAEAAKK
jgi:hypothetical protein